ncbi:MAG: hypothetical protein QNK23_08495 [Crocinitomicaceae bacterium]|nr:hypothetical protein [Crocinitomicaceae bacterium]
MRVLFYLLAIVLLTSCEKDEVEPTTPTVPVPVPVVDLNAHFFGTINGAQLELTQNVQGYYGAAWQDYIINLPNGEATYSFNMQSGEFLTAIEISHGSITWDASGGNNTPSLSAFNEFHSIDTLPSYTTGGINGFEISFIDFSGNVWQSNDMSPSFQTVKFSNVLQESDATGDYSKFLCEFTCYVYNTGLNDSLLIENASLQGWFQY